MSTTTNVSYPALRRKKVNGAIVVAFGLLRMVPAVEGLGSRV